MDSAPLAVGVFLVVSDEGHSQHRQGYILDPWYHAMRLVLNLYDLPPEAHDRRLQQGCLPLTRGIKQPTPPTRPDPQLGCL